MKLVCSLLATVAIAYALPATAASLSPEMTLSLPLAEASALGQIDKLVVTVTCGRISSLKDIPNLYNIEFGYDIPTEVVLQASPRLGAAAVELGRWSHVVRVRSEDDACFNVTVTAEGRTGESRHWNARQLGVRK